MKAILKATTLIFAFGLGTPPALAEGGYGSPYPHHRGPNAAYAGGALAYGRGYAVRPARFVGYGRPGPRLGYAGYPRRAWHFGYRPRVRYAYAETPYAYDLPGETYATGIFATTSVIGLHTYDYAYTTQVRPIAAYGGATGSYAGGYPIYNRPLAPAYPTPGCDCEY